MKTRIIEIDELANKCGFFTSSYNVNNGYGCKHPNNEEWEFVDRNGLVFIASYGVEKHIISQLTTRKISCNRRLAKKFIKKAREIMSGDITQLNKYGVQVHRKCFAFSCPLGSRCDAQDFIEHDEDPFMFDVENHLVIPNIYPGVPFLGQIQISN